MERKNRSLVEKASSFLKLDKLKAKINAIFLPKEKDPLFSEFVQKYDARIKFALKHPLPFNEYKSSDWTEEEKESREVDIEEWNNIMDDIMNDPTYVFFDNPHEFLLLKKYFKDMAGLFYKNFEHESEHWFAAQEMGMINPKIGVYFFLNSKGEDRVQYGMIAGKFPQGVTPSEAFQMDLAWTDYPTYKSPGDKKILEQKFVNDLPVPEPEL